MYKEQEEEIVQLAKKVKHSTAAAAAVVASGEQRQRQEPVNAEDISYPVKYSCGDFTTEAYKEGSLLNCVFYPLKYMRFTDKPYDGVRGIEIGISPNFLLRPIIRLVDGSTRIVLSVKQWKSLEKRLSDVSAWFRYCNDVDEQTTTRAAHAAPTISTSEVLDDGGLLDITDDVSIIYNKREIIGHSGMFLVSVKLQQFERIFEMDRFNVAGILDRAEIINARLEIMKASELPQYFAKKIRNVAQSLREEWRRLQRQQNEDEQHLQQQHQHLKRARAYNEEEGNVPFVFDIEDVNAKLKDALDGDGDAVEDEDRNKLNKLCVLELILTNRIYAKRCIKEAFTQLVLYNKCVF